MSRSEQKANTRTRLLDATVASLVEFGYAGTTTQRIQEAAGVSRGALLHHFGSKSELLVAAIHHVAEVRVHQITEVSAGFAESRDPMRAMVTEIRAAMTGPAFQASLELWSASRTDPQLAAALLPAERKLGSALREIFGKYSGIADLVAQRLAFESLMALVRGLEITRHLRPDPAAADAVVDDWLRSHRHLTAHSAAP